MYRTNVLRIESNDEVLQISSSDGWAEIALFWTIKRPKKKRMREAIFLCDKRDIKMIIEHLTALHNRMEESIDEAK